MRKQYLYGFVNPFERIAGLEALLWGLGGGNGSFNNSLLFFSLALSWIVAFWSGS